MSRRASVTMRLSSAEADPRRRRAARTYSVPTLSHVLSESLSLSLSLMCCQSLHFQRYLSKYLNLPLRALLPSEAHKVPASLVHTKRLVYMLCIPYRDLTALKYHMPIEERVHVHNYHGIGILRQEHEQNMSSGLADSITLSL